MSIKVETPGTSPAPQPTSGPKGTEGSAGAALGAAAIITVLVTLISYVGRDYAATGIGLTFCGACAWLVLRHDTPVIRHYGLALGGALEPTPLEGRRLAQSALTATLWALGFALVLFPPFALGFRIYWHIGAPFRLMPALRALGDELLGQFLVVALPEEAFYRGYLMTALDDAWGTPWRIAGAKVGLGLVISCAVFAIGHILTQPDPGRLAVFFPALLFGWLRARTKGVGAGVALHAFCNLFASLLARGYGFAG